MASSTKTLSPAPVWIQGPALDFIVGCGAWSAPLLAFAYLTTVAQTAAWSIVFYALALFFNYPHYMATLYRAFHDRENFRKYRFFTVYVTGAFLLLLVLCHAYMRLLPLVFTLYLTWSPWHYSGQNYGILAMFSRRAGAQPSPVTRRLLYASFIVSYAVLFLALHTGVSNDPLFVSLDIPEAWSKPALVILTTAFAGLAISGIGGLIRQVGIQKLTAPLVLLSTQFLWFVLPSLLHLTSGFSIPQGRYSTGVMAVMHSAQYLWITHYFQRREASANGVPWRPFAYFGVLVLGGIALFVPGPWISAYLFHADFRSSFLVFTALVNLHHFVLDGAIWKLRDGRIASLLLASHDRVAAAASSAVSRAGRLVRARPFQVSLATLLLGWAVLDQARSVLLTDGQSLKTLQIAARLNPYDSAVQQRLAQAHMEAANPEAALVAWEKAADLDPRNPAPRVAALRYLVDHQKLEDAYRLTSHWTKLAPRDADLWVNHGILAQRFGNHAEARAAWEHALQVDARQRNAHLYLADLADKEHRPAEAIPHYSAYLQSLTQTPPLPPAQAVVPVMLRLSECLAASGELEAAIRSGSSARNVATSAHEPRLESIASTSEADLRLKVGDMAGATALYQRALRLDAGLNDPQLESLDWLNYAVLLRNRGMARPSYASLLKARQLAGSNAPELTEIRQGLDELATHAPAQVKGVDRNLPAALTEALAVK